MSTPSRSSPGTRAWIARARSLRDRATREREGTCFVEGIRPVISANEAGHPIEALLVDPTTLRSEAAWKTVSDAQRTGAQLIELKPGEFGRISTRDNPVGIAAIVRWSPRPLDELTPRTDGLYLVADDVRDPGNLGTLIRTLDAAGGSAIIVHAGTDAAHPAAIRSSLGSCFHVPCYSAGTLDEVFGWSSDSGTTTVATSARAQHSLWASRFDLPIAVLVGNEGDGLSPATLSRCDNVVSIPMFGSATSLNVGVAAGIVLFHISRAVRDV